MASATDTPADTAVNPAVEALLERLNPAELDLRGRQRVRLEVTGAGATDVELDEDGGRIVETKGRPDALLAADAATWRRIARDLPSGMAAFGNGRLRIRTSLHLGVNFLAATSGNTDPERLRFRTYKTKRGALSTLSAGSGKPLVLLHGLGGTKASFLPTVAALAPQRRVIAVDLPGFGESAKPLGAAYDAPFFSRAVKALLDELEIERTDLLGHSMGGRVALEFAMFAPERLDHLVLQTPSMAWLRERTWAPWLRWIRPELGVLQPAPRAVVEAFVKRIVPGGDSSFAAAGIDEFLRSYLTPRGRAAFYAAARKIYMEEPERFWNELRDLAVPSMFVWGTRDPLVPAAFEKHVREAVPSAEHVVLNSGHIPQIERPDELHAAIARFLSRP